MTTDSTLLRALLPPRAPEGNKGSFGKLLLICGSAEMRGAAALAVLGALRMGAGLVTLASTRDVIRALSASLYEPIYLDCEQKSAVNAADSMTAVGIGCGMGQSIRTSETVTALLARPGAPLVIDADGINVLAGKADLLKGAARPVLLTPHPLEFSRLCGKPVAEIQADREGTAKAFARAYGVTLLLKGHHTVITDGETVCINPTGGSALAKGGTGDVLCGMICAFAAQGCSLFNAAVIAAYLHGAAGDRLAKVYSDYGVLASELPAEAARLLAELTKG